MECLRVCPNDNVSFNLRGFGRDFVESRRRLRSDETALALVMLGCVLSFSILFLGPWGGLRTAAYAVGTLPWALYSAVYLAFAGLAVPGLYALAVRLGGPLQGFARTLNRFARPLLPLGLATWVAFTISFAFAKISYVLPVIGDPFGVGWNLFGLATVHFAPDVSLVAPLAQAAVLLIGLLWSGRVARQDADTPRRALALQGYALAITLGMVWVLMS
jgi:hypothetical protein